MANELRYRASDGSDIIITLPSTNCTMLDAAATSMPGLTAVGTIVTGVWNGTAIANANLANSSITVNGTSITLGASSTITAAAATLTGTTINATVTLSSLTTLGTIVTGVWNGTTIAIANGGTGQVTAVLAFNALSPITTKGDILSNDGSNDIRLAVGSNGQMLVADSAQSSGLRWAVNATAQSSPADPATTTSATGVMMGLAVSITPLKSGTIMIIVSGDIDNSGTSNTVQTQLRTGTGSAPSNGAALTGTARGGLIKQTNPTVGLSSPVIRTPVSLNCIITGLTVGAAVWIDVSLAAIGGGTARLRDVSISAIEI